MPVYKKRLKFFTYKVLIKVVLIAQIEFISIYFHDTYSYSVDVTYILISGIVSTNTYQKLNAFWTFYNPTLELSYC